MTHDLAKVKYWGERRIAERMGCSVSYLRRLRDQCGFLMLKLPNPGWPHTPSGPREIWYTDESLITYWKLMVFRGQRRQRNEKREKARLRVEATEKSRPA